MRRIEVMAIPTYGGAVKAFATNYRIASPSNLYRIKINPLTTLKWKFLMTSGRS